MSNFRYEFYDREKIPAVSGWWRPEGNQQICSGGPCTAARSPEGSNAKCIAMDKLTEFLFNLDLDDFRNVPIEGLFADQAEHPPAC
jgi:hypothetical protein